jgi:RNA polymerase sigma factor (sigma-70 family)
MKPGPTRIVMDDASPEAAAAESARGIHDLASAFTAIYREITRGVKDAKPSDVDPQEWKDVLQDVLVDAWDINDSDPRYFADVPPRKWARSAAQNRFKNRLRNTRRRAEREKSYMQVLPSYYDAEAMEDLIRRERRSAVTRKFLLLAPRTRSVLAAVDVQGLTRRAAAALLGLSERMVKRELDEGRPRLAVMLSEWDPRGSLTGRRAARGDSVQRERGDHE